MQQYFRIATFQIRRQKVRTDHLQAVAERLVSPQYDGCRLDRWLDDGNLAIEDREVLQQGWMQMSVVPRASRTSKFITKNVAVNPRMILSRT
jgi:hypothetical protein